MNRPTILYRNRLQSPELPPVIGSRYLGQPRPLDADALLLQQALLREPQERVLTGVINAAGAIAVLLLPLLLWLLGVGYAP
jgi:hypothetical protein